MILSSEPEREGKTRINMNVNPATGVIKHFGEIACLVSPKFAVTFSNWLRVAVAFSVRKVSSSEVSCQTNQTKKKNAS